jgi:hypothetical protein
VYFDNEVTPAITMTDSAFSSGRFALASYHGISTFNNVSE